MFILILILGFFITINAKSLNESKETDSTAKVTNFSVVPGNITKDGKTYFFKYNTNSNQFRIYNRVNSNGLIVKNYTGTSIKKKSMGANRSDINELRKFEAYLDEEWNYSTHTKLNTTQLPAHIYPFLYNSIVKKLSAKGDYGEKVPGVIKILFNKKKNNSLALNFHLGKMDPSYQVDNAELHFYWSVAENTDLFKSSCVLRLYQVENEDSGAVSESNPDRHKLLNVIYVSKAQTGWQMFRISRKSIEDWVNLNEELRLLISLSQANQVNTSTIFNDTDNETKWRTFLVLRINDTRDKEAEDFEIAPFTNYTHFGSNSDKYCSLKNFYIDFRKLFWSNFIIAPEGFMAYDCFGKCTRHNTDTFSNHLKMLTTFQDVDKKTRGPCCVPVKFYSLPIMYYDQQGNVIMKVYKDLIVAKCGCR